MHNYGIRVNGTEDVHIYSLLSGDSGALTAVHEFCHGFCHPLADKWLEENEAFRKWCEETINPVVHPTYGSLASIAHEYVIRAYTALYAKDHGQNEENLLDYEKRRGFTYIEEVYKLVLENEGR
jgi:hypothetical protein